MGFRIHTAAARSIRVEAATVTEVDEAYGYEHIEQDKDNEILLITDQGNQEALAITGDREDWFRLAHEILEVVALNPHFKTI